MKHYVFTRYNLDLYSSNPYKVADPDAWMEHRLELFRDMAESVAEQSCKDFEWVIWLDQDTPLRYVAEVTEVAREAGHDTIIMEPPEVMTSQMTARGCAPARSFLAARHASHEGHKHIMQTRFDNDDLMHYDFIRTLQMHYRGEEEVLDVRGLKIYPDGREAQVLRRYANSPWLTLVEKVRTTAFYRSVYTVAHTYMATVYPGRIIDEQLVRVRIHDRNASNT